MTRTIGLLALLVGLLSLSGLGVLYLEKYELECIPRSNSDEIQHRPGGRLYGCSDTGPCARICEDISR